mgnify:FL=1
MAARMVVQLDIDNTIDQALDFFRWLAKSLRRDGHTVLIVSSRTRSPENLKHTARELKDWGIEFDKLVLHPAPAELDPKRLPPGLPPAHKIYVYKLIAAQDLGTQILFDYCGITTDLFRWHLPGVNVFRLLR